MRVLVVVVVVDRHADVVQHACARKQLAVLVAEASITSARQPVVDLERQRRHVAHVRRGRAETAREVLHRLAAHVLDERRVRPSRRRSKKIPSRSPASVTSSSSKPPSFMAAASTSAPPRITSPRSGLMPATLPRLEAGLAGELLHQLIEHVGGQHEAPHPAVRVAALLLRRGGEVADAAADAGKAPAAGPPVEALDLLRDMLAHRLQLLRGRLLVGKELLAHPHGAERQRLRLAQQPVLERASSWMLPPPMSMPKPSESVVEFAIAR